MTVDCDSLACQWLSQKRLMNSEGTSTDSKEVTELPPEIRFRVRFGLWAAAWAIAFISTGGTFLEKLFLAWFFPYGLLGLLSPAIWESPGDFSIVVFGWAFYVGLTVYALMQVRRYRYFVAYGVLFVFLVLNIVGCHVQSRHPWISGC